MPNAVGMNSSRLSLVGAPAAKAQVLAIGLQLLEGRADLGWADLGLTSILLYSSEDQRYPNLGYIRSVGIGIVMAVLGI